MSQIDYQIRFPEDSSDLREQEYFYVVRDGAEEKFVIQNYAEVFKVPLLYEKFCSETRYQSPETLAMLLVSQLVKSKIDMESLIIFDNQSDSF
ncbi:MAG: hypothetical protein AAFO04_26975 [Cyanobacteria bacterium J06592_8]